MSERRVTELQACVRRLFEAHKYLGTYTTVTAAIVLVVLVGK